jgi:hypothetical protein
VVKRLPGREAPELQAGVSSLNELIHLLPRLRAVVLVVAEGSPRKIVH